MKGGYGLQQDYGMRIYDPRIARFLSVDPLTKGYPELTPYLFASNSPIQGIDLDGGELRFMKDWLADKVKAHGHAVLSGFIRRVGANDIGADVGDFIINVAKGDLNAAGLQIYGHTSLGAGEGLVNTIHTGC